MSKLEPGYYYAITNDDGNAYQGSIGYRTWGERPKLYKRKSDVSSASNRLSDRYIKHKVILVSLHLERE